MQRVDEVHKIGEISGCDLGLSCHQLLRTSAVSVSTQGKQQQEPGTYRTHQRRFEMTEVQGIPFIPSSVGKRRFAELCSTTSHLQKCTEKDYCNLLGESGLRLKNEKPQPHRPGFSFLPKVGCLKITPLLPLRSGGWSWPAQCCGGSRSRCLKRGR